MKAVKVTWSSQVGKSQHKAELAGEMRKEKNRGKVCHQPVQLCWAIARLVTHFKLQMRITTSREKYPGDLRHSSEEKNIR